MNEASYRVMTHSILFDELLISSRGENGSLFPRTGLTGVDCKNNSLLPEMNVIWQINRQQYMYFPVSEIKKGDILSTHQDKKLRNENALGKSIIDLQLSRVSYLVLELNREIHLFHYGKYRLHQSTDAATSLRTRCYWLPWVRGLPFFDSTIKMWTAEVLLVLPLLCGEDDLSPVELLTCLGNLNAQASIFD